MVFFSSLQQQGLRLSVQLSSLFRSLLFNSVLGSSSVSCFFLWPAEREGDERTGSTVHGWAWRIDGGNG
jgi:hypothetical protein